MIKSNYIKKISKSCFVILMFFISSFFQIIPIILFNMDVNNLTANNQLLLTIFSDTIFLIILVLMYKKDLKKDFNNLKKEPYKFIDTGFKYWLIGLIVMVVSNLIINFFITKAQAGNEESVQALIKGSSYLSILAIGILAPIIEELTFRKAFKDIFSNKWIFAFISSIVFGGLHVILSLNSFWDLFYLVPYCSLGFAFALMYNKTDNIYTSMIMHIFHNTILTTISIMGAMIIL